jgi:putative oxidoreductase
MSRLSKIGNVIVWILACLLAFVFLDVGWGKLISQRVYVHEFELIGMGQWFRYVVGALEVLGGIGVLIPKYRFLAAMGLSVLMIGATAANIFQLRAPPLVGLSAVLFTLAVTLALMNWRDVNY